MDTYVRGFSFMPESKIEMDLKYVDSEALERTWKIARRERLKQQEQKIWEEFVQEQDIVEIISKEDPYQFLNQLPEECIKELLEIELQKMKQEKTEGVHTVELPAEPSSVAVDNQHTVTFSEAVDNEESNMFHIFDDDRDDDVSGPEEEALNDSAGSPPCTVRERPAEDRDHSPEHRSPDNISSKSSTENVTSMIEGSIYCARVKDIRIKINDQLLEIISFLEQQDIINIDPSDVPKMMRRSVEFCGRFNRVHAYQMQRQVSAVRRHAARAPPALRTHGHAQLVRAASLHRSLLHALQVFHKSLPQTACIKDSAELLHSLVLLVGEVTGTCGDARPPNLAAAVDLYDDSIQETCDKLVETLNEYSCKMSDYLNSTENTSASCSRKSSKQKTRKRSTVGGNPEARLSMYSLGPLRATARSGFPKDNQSHSGTSKMLRSIGARSKANKDDQPKSPKKSPRSRRPLMRAPQPLRARAAHEQRVRTLVESVAPCTSSHISREGSPYRSPKSKNVTPRQRSREETQRTPRSREFARTSENDTPRDKVNTQLTGPQQMSPNTIKTSPVKKASPKTAQSDIPKIKTPVILQNPKLVEPVDKNEIAQLKLNDKESSEPKKTEQESKYANSEEPKTSVREKNKPSESASCEVTRLVRQLCGGDTAGNRGERVSDAKNAQLLCVNGGSPRQANTPHLLRILEETIQKKAPKPLFPKQKSARDPKRYRMAFNISERVTDGLFQYRTKFVQHMLTSSMYANSAVGKPWEKISSVSDKIIDELLLNCSKEMELQKLIDIIYDTETS